MIRKVTSDAGRTQGGFADEKKDCTVRALVNAGNLSYEQAHKIMAEEGREYGGFGRVFAGILNAHKKNLLDFKHVELRVYQKKFNRHPGFVGRDNKAIMWYRWTGPTIKQFISEHSKGRYIVTIKRHAFAIIDGAIHDLFKQHAGATVLSAWEIIL
jgi:hypothetical protein